MGIGDGCCTETTQTKFKGRAKRLVWKGRLLVARGAILSQQAERVILLLACFTSPTPPPTILTCSCWWKRRRCSAGSLSSVLRPTMLRRHVWVKAWGIDFTDPLADISVADFPAVNEELKARRQVRLQSGARRRWSGGSTNADSHRQQTAQHPPANHGLVLLGKRAHGQRVVDKKGGLRAPRLHNGGDEPVQQHRQRVRAARICKPRRVSTIPSRAFLRSLLNVLGSRSHRGAALQAPPAAAARSLRCDKG